MIRLFKYLTEKVPTQASQKEESNADSPSLTKGVEVKRQKKNDLNLKIFSKPDQTNKDQNEDMSSLQGKIIKEDDGLYQIETNDETYWASNSSGNYKFMKGDKVELRGKFETGEHASCAKFKVDSMMPLLITKEFGRVSSINTDGIVFEEKYVFLADSEKLPDVTVNQEFLIEIVESQQQMNDLIFNFRVLNFTNEVNDTTDGRIIFKDMEFKVEQSTKNYVKKYLKLHNKSSHLQLIVTGHQLDPAINVLKAQKVVNPIKVRPLGTYSIPLTITPRDSGTTEFEFKVFLETTTEEKFTKQCKITVTVCTIQETVICNSRSNNMPRFKDRRMKFYEVPQDLRLINFTKSSAKQELLEVYPVLGEKLTTDNYESKMTLAIFIEEISLELAFGIYRMTKARFENEKHLLRLKVKDLAEKRPSIIIGDTVFAKDPYDEENAEVWKGSIKKIENESILIEFNEDFLKGHHGKEFSIEFTFSRSNFRKKHHAIETFLTEGMGFDFLFPSERPAAMVGAPQLKVNLNGGNLELLGKSLPWYDQRLNIYQKQAIVNVLRGELCRPMPYIIYGPPGTGKTRTVVELIHQIFCVIPTSTIIVATPSNSAANLFTESLAKSQKLKGNHDFIRLVSNNQVENNLIPDTLLKYCATVSTSSDDGTSELKVNIDSTGLQRQITKSKIRNYRICISTLSSFGSLMEMIFPQNHFTHVFIDEAGQCTEPELLIPITLLTKGTGQVILSGDPKQLGPISICRFSKSLETDISLLERLLNTDVCYGQIYGDEESDFDPRYVTKLKLNYRSLPSILWLYNDTFYRSELEGTVNEDDSPEAGMLSNCEEILFNPQAAKSKCGIYFVDVNGTNRKEADSCSWFNTAEIDGVFSFLCKLNAKGISFEDVGVITPYSLQVKKLKHKASGLPDTGLKIGTVEEFQGQERQIILLSTVRTAEKYISIDQKYGLGFLECEKRINVSISRARTLLIVFGKADILKINRCWRKLIDYCHQNGTFSKL